MFNIFQIIQEINPEYNHEALANICFEYYPKIYRYIYYRIQQKEEAEDITSEVFLRLVKSVDKIKGGFQGWLYKIAENLLVDYFRRRGVRVRVMETVEDLDAIPEEKSDTMELLKQDDLERDMKFLTTDQYKMIILKYVEGYSTKEIAEIMHKSVGAIKALQFRALETLRKFFTEDTND
ncbi:MAG: sigma-70 family RNA polymerase sigma factor [candidate division Zixibacteria bacterium]|nr:sigma-70 family RNA polymerase sigma factor [Candidatus Tariuqbacter arcticus]